MPCVAQDAEIERWNHLHLYQEVERENFDQTFHVNSLNEDGGFI